MSCLSLKSYVQHQPHPDEYTDQGTASETDERKRKSRVGENTCGNRDIGKGLERYQGSHADTQEPAGQIPGPGGHHKTFIYYQ